MKKKLLFLLLTTGLYASTAFSQTPDYTFVTVGCNRVDYLDTAATTGMPNSTGASTANVYQLKRLFTEVSQMNPLPKYLFLTGDIVMGYINDTVALAKQLKNWKLIYTQHPLSSMGIQLVVIPGNHETQDKAAGKKSFVAAERTFLREMAPYIIGSNGPGIGGADNLATDQSHLTYSFNYGCDHFVVINTDPVGQDARTPYKWIANDIKNARLGNARHIFALGHKPAYSSPMKPLDGLEAFVPERDSLWKYLEYYQCEAMFAAHEHLWDSIHPHAGKTWQVIAGNGGSLVEATFMGPDQSYFGYTLVSIYTNNEVNVKGFGRYADMAHYSLDGDAYPTTLRTNFNLGVNPVINHAPLANSNGNGPFTVVATITDDIALNGTLLNYSVNGSVQTPINASISGNTYTFTIPVQPISGVLQYNIQATDASGISFYSTGCSNKMNLFTFGIQTRPSSSQSPYVLPTIPGAEFTSILTTPDVVGGYKMVGIPDGLGAFDNGNGTFTVLMNHELGNTVGVVRAHGSKGAFVSKWIIKKSNLAIVSGSDLIQNVKLWNGSGYTTYNSANPSSLAAFSRFCSADLPPVSAFYNSTTGLGTQERIFMNGEESNDESRAFAHIVTGPNAGTTYELPFLGKASWENSVASPNTGNKTVVGLLNDGTDGQVYFYVGTKTNTGTEIDKAGLNNGHAFGIKVTGFAKERVNTTTLNPLPAPGTHFDMVDMGSVENMTGVAFNTASNAAGVTSFSRPEDGAWDPSHSNDFYFNTTDQIDQVNDGLGSQIGRTRVWHLRFDNITSPKLGGTIEAVLDGTEGMNMLDNMAIDNYGHILLLEDVGNSKHNGKVWQYTIATDAVTMVGKHDPTRFGDITVPATAPYNQDEETSGIIDVQNILGQGMFLLVDQAHYPISGEAVEGGQLLAYFNPDTYNAAPNAFAVNGGGLFCFGKPGVSVGLSGSETGVNYQLVVNGSTNIGTPIAGTGSSITFGIQTIAGTYTVIAKNAASTVSANMTGSVTVTANPAITVNAGSNQMVYVGYAPKSCATLTATGISGGTPGYSILWSTGATTNSVTVCPITGTNYSVTITDFKGCSVTDSVKICAQNVVCSSNPNSKKIEVCHNKSTLCVSENAVAAHLAHGDYLGTCGSNNCESKQSSLCRRESDIGINTKGFSTNLYPNPVSSFTQAKLEIEAEGSSSVSAVLYNISGQEIRTLLNRTINEEGEFLELVINTSDLLPGIYFIKTISTSGYLKVDKLIITK